jgi:transcriptional regulator GlxA family with amidase domain
MDVAIVVFDGVDELDAIGPFEVLRAVARERPELRVSLVGLRAPATIEGALGLRIEVLSPIPERCDWLVVSGGGWASGAAQGVRAQIASGTLPAEIRRLREGGASVASVCTGAMLLSAAGVLRGRPCTTHQVARDALAAEGGVLVDARVVDDGDVVTCGGVTSGIDLALHLVARWLGS